MSNNPLPAIRASHVVTPNPYTTSLGVQFLGSPTYSYYSFTAAVPKRRAIGLGAGRAPSVLHVSIGAHAVLRQQCYAFQRSLGTETGQRVLRDFVLALAQLDGRRLMQISGYLSRGATQARAAAATGPNRVPRPRVKSDRERAVELLAQAGRPDDGLLVEEVASRFSRLPAREQVIAGQAIRAIIDAFTYLSRLTPQARDLPGADGNTPVQDAGAAVDAALRRLAESLDEAQRGDTESLRALRLYATQWSRGDDDPLRLD